MNVCLVVKVLNNENVVVKGYTKSLDLPFLPTVGMRFDCGTSTMMWETQNGELSPKVKEVVYHIDEKTIYCLFEINEPLVATFWREIPEEILQHSFELGLFKTRF